MPELEWIGKSKVVNHHLDVPYHVLKRKYVFDASGEHDDGDDGGNMIIHGDNLLALKSLLPQYEGRVDCIYIDPPYNTGEEKWVYNDNVNDPKIRAWLGKVVGKEGEDLSRHDKWLCMMYPRLKLLWQLLADDGAIFISIDDHEQASLKLICDEIFGEQNFIDTVVWEKRYSPQNAAKWLSESHEFVLLYAKGKSQWHPNLLQRSEEMNARYQNPDNDTRGVWKPTDATAQAGHGTAEQFYVFHANGNDYKLPKGRCWVYRETVMEQMMKENRVWFGEDGTSRPALKRFLSDVKQGMVCKTIWGYKEVGHSQDAKKEILSIFPDEIPFDTPKPSKLIERVVELATDKDSIVLDSFAGSGTTAQAVLNENKKDGGNRHFILVEMEDYADSLTSRRVKRAIQGYMTDHKDVLYDVEITKDNIQDGRNLFNDGKEIAQDAKKKYDKVEGPKMVDGHLRVVGIWKAKCSHEGTGGSFGFYELGDVLMQDGKLNGNVDVEELRKYVYFMETKRVLPPASSEEPYLLGVSAATAYYFYYERESVTRLDMAFLRTVKTKAEGYVIYADLCNVSEEFLKKHHIVFRKIPRDIRKL